MKQSNVVSRWICWFVIMVGIAILSPSEFAGERAAATPQRQRAATAITILDQNGRPVPSARPSATSQIFDVTVGPGGVTVFSPDTLNISVGDTVRWTWDSSFHSVSSGTPCAIDSQFCSPDDMNCALGTLSTAGTVYQHTFGQAGSYSYFCFAHCSRGMVGTINVASACTPPPANMVSWWPGDGNAQDIQGGHNGSLQGGATFAPGKVDQAFSFNGTTAYVSVPDDPNLYPSGSFTVDAWIKTSQTTGTQQIINHYECANFCPPGASSDYEMSVIDGKLSGFIRDTTGANQALTGTTAIANGTFHHVAMQRDIAGGEMRLYLDGTLETSATLVPTGVLQNDDGEADPVTIGAVIQNNNPGCGCPIQFFSGVIDEVEYFSRALTAAEIAAIADAGNAGKCKAPQLTGAFSRKTHGGAGTFDIDLMPSGTPGIECRSGGASGVYQMIVQFPDPVTVAGATLITGTGSVSGFSVSGGVVTIDLSNIANVQTIVVRLISVSDGTRSGDVPVPMGVLIGDTTGNRSVNAGDVAQTKGQSGQPVTAANFREDVNANGSINAGDVALVKSKSGTSLP